MPPADRIPLDDARAALRIVAECRERGADARLWHAHLLARLRELLRGTVVIGGNMQNFVPGHLPKPLLSIRMGWDTAEAEKHWLEYVSTVPVVRTPEYAQLAGFKGPLVTRRRDELWDKREWYRSEAYNERHRVCGVDDYIISISATPKGGLFNSIWVHRAVGDKAFTRREWLLANMIHAEIGPLIGGPLASPVEPSIADLSPRLRQTLDRILRGDSEKQIATHLGVSRPTAHEYVSALYRHFTVSSRGELMALFIGRAIPPDMTDAPPEPAAPTKPRRKPKPPAQ